MTRNAALVAGAGGIIGNAVAHQFMRAGWTVRALGRRPVAGVPSIEADLTDAGATARHFAEQRIRPTSSTLRSHLIQISRTRRPETPLCSATCSTG